MTTTTLADGLLTKKIPAIATQGTAALIQSMRFVTFSPEPLEPAQAMAHLALCEPSGVIVVAQRGPRGGWAYCKYTTAVSPRFMEKLARHGKTFHAGWAQNA